MNPDWPRALRDQCVAAKVPFFFKQFGEWGDRDAWMRHCDERQTNTYDWPKGSVRAVFPDGASNGLKGAGEKTMFRVGKRAAGRLLDGREWNEFPEAPQG